MSCSVRFMDVLGWMRENDVFLSHLPARVTGGSSEEISQNSGNQAYGKPSLIDELMDFSERTFEIFKEKAWLREFKIEIKKVNRMSPTFSEHIWL